MNKPLLQTRLTTFGDREIAHVLSAVGELFGDPDMFLSLLSRCLIVAAKKFGVSRGIIVRNLEKDWDATETAKISVVPKAVG